MIVDWKKDFLSDKGIYEVFLASRRFPKSDSNKKLLGMCLMLACGLALKWIIGADTSASYQAVLMAADIAFSLTIQILGFLIGGFAIFATVSDPTLMSKLAQAPMQGTKVSVFKYIFFNFLSVFYIYTVTLALSVIIKIIGHSNITLLLNVFDLTYKPAANTLANSAVFVFSAMAIAVCVVRLKSFIWNIYQAFITFLVVSDTLE